MGRGCLQLEVRRLGTDGQRSTGSCVPVFEKQTLERKHEPSLFQLQTVTSDCRQYLELAPKDVVYVLIFTVKTGRPLPPRPSRQQEQG